MAGINPATGQWDLYYTPPPTSPAPPAAGTVISKSQQTHSDGSVWEVTVTADGQGGTRTATLMISGPTTKPPAGTTTSATIPSTSTPPPATAPTPAADPNVPPSGQDPDAIEVVYENGRAVRTVYKYTANGHTKGQTVTDLSGLWGKYDSITSATDFNTFAQNQGLPFQSDITQASPYQGMAALIAKLNDPNLPASDRQAAQDELAREKGFATGQDYNASLNAQGQTLAGGPSNQQGMTDAEKLAYQKLSAGQLQDLQGQQQKQLDAILSGQTGNSTARALMTANENVKTIRDAQLQSTVSLMNMDYARKLDAFDRQAGMYKDALDRGEMTTQSLMAAFKDNRLTALQGFAQQTATILQQNQQYLNMYSADLDKIRTNADIVYKSIQTELGIDEAAQQQTANEFDKWAAQQAADLLKQQQAAAEQGNIFDIILGGLSILGGVLLGFGTGWTGIGALAGGGLISGGIGLIGQGAS